MPTCCSKICHDFLCVLGLVSTVANLRGYWLLLDNFLLHDNFIFTVVVLGVVGFSSLTLLKMLSSLHGGVVMINDYSRPSLFPSWILTYWLIKVRYLLKMLEISETLFFRTPVKRDIAVIGTGISKKKIIY